LLDGPLRLLKEGSNFDTRDQLPLVVQTEVRPNSAFLVPDIGVPSREQEVKVQLIEGLIVVSVDLAS